MMAINVEAVYSIARISQSVCIVCNGSMCIIYLESHELDTWMDVISNSTTTLTEPHDYMTRLLYNRSLSVADRLNSRPHNYILHPLDIL